MEDAQYEADPAADIMALRRMINENGGSTTEDCAKTRLDDIAKCKEKYPNGNDSTESSTALTLGKRVSTGPMPNIEFGSSDRAGGLAAGSLSPSDIRRSPGNGRRVTSGAALQQMAEGELQPVPLCIQVKAKSACQQRHSVEVPLSFDDAISQLRASRLSRRIRP